MKKLLFTTLVLALLGLVFCASALAESTAGTCGDDVIWVLEDGKLTISGTGPMKDYDTPSASPFYRNLKIKKIEIRNGVTSIGQYVFASCYNVATVTIPNSVQSLGKHCFDFCCYALTEITIPEGVTVIPEYAFSNCAELISVTLPSTVTEIGDYAFYSCKKLASVELPSSVGKLGKAAFLRCLALESVNIPYNVTSIGEACFKECSSLASLTLTEAVTSIGANAFADCGSLTVSCYDDTVAKTYCDDNSIPYILLSNKCGDDLTWSMSGTTLTISGTGNMYDYSASEPSPFLFRKDKIKLVVFDSGVSQIGYYAFSGCDQIAIVSVPQNSEMIGIASYAFQNCSSLISISLPDNLIAIGIRAFSGCSSLTRIHIPASTQILASAFADCPNLTIYSDISSVAYEYAVSHSIPFKGYMDEPDFTLPAELAVIGDEAFSGISAEVIYIPDGTTSIGEQAFANCPNLRQIRFPASVASVQSSALDGCPDTAIVVGSSAMIREFAEDAGFAYVTQAD